ncbi:ABC transporter ATP-binding protein [Anaerolineales bacterium HSG24]|nr:ABC transporter ATP-binding protein [Anaerolineales bacterium HSG24]
MNEKVPVIEMRDVTKVFPGVIANDHINLAVHEGEVLGLLGENGAGKSVLMSILYGLYQPTEGEIFVRGKPVAITGPKVAIEQGIGMVHQHFMLVPVFTVAENIVLGDEPITNVGTLNTAKAVNEIKALSEKYNLEVDPHAKIEDISVGMGQRVEILKTMYRGAQVLILDEPTAVLTPQEIKGLFEIMHSLTEAGFPVIFISHKLKELMEVCDRVTVIRRGKMIGTIDIEDASPQILASMMVGRDVVLEVEKKPSQPKEVVLEVENIHAVGLNDLPVLNGVSFKVHAGEIVGIAGVAGNGQSELIEVITGLHKANSGDVRLNNETITNHSAKEIIHKGIATIPEDRHHRGLVLDFSIADNGVLGSHDQPPFARWIQRMFDAIRAYADKFIQEFDVRTPNQEAQVKNLSGGNQQKVIIAREIGRKPDLLIAAQPTRGVDVGAIEFIHRRIIEQRDAGKAVLVISNELDEVMGLSDRILVMFHGEIVGEILAKDATEDELGLYMAGAKRNTPSSPKEVSK